MVSKFWLILNLGSCFPWDNSWSTWENSSQWTSWSDNMYLNSTTQLWQTWSQGQYFDATVNMWRSWDGSWLKGCSYQSNCFIWQTGQYYDLESKSWVTTWGINTVIVNSSQYHSIPICKSANIYVDPSSSSIIELGTQNDPYKNLVLAFIDVLNIFAHRNISINIYIKENKILPVTIGSMYIINIPQVSITTYTDSGTNPRQSTIVYSDSSVVILSKSTLFNIVSSTAINISSALNNSILLTAEKNSLQAKNIGLMIDRWNLSIKNVYFATNFTLNSTSFTFMRAVYQQLKSITISNASFKVKGNLFDTYDPLNFNATNIDIDYVDTPRGFYFQISWNYTGASTQNEIYFNNLTVYNSQARTIDMVGSLISFSGAANFTMLNSNIAIYGSISNPYPPIQFISNSGWNLNDGITQNFRITGSQFTLNQDSEYSKYIQFYSNLDSSYLRPVTISIGSLVFNGIVMSSQPLIKMYVNDQTQILSNNMTISGATFKDDVMHFSAANYVSLTAFTFKNITQLGNQIVHFDSVNMVDMSNIVIDGCNFAANDQLYYFLHRSNSGYFNVTGLVARNMNVNSRYIIYTTGVPSFIITNSIFESISISSYDSLMKTGTISELFIDSVNFTQIKSNTPGDNTNYLFDYDSFDLSKTTNFYINNIVITKSELAMLNINKISGVPRYSKYLNISNLEYSNSTFTDSNDIMTFTGMEQSIDFTISLTNIKFSSISFSTSGNLLLFQQQLSSPIVISSILLSNLTNAYILIEADDSHSLLLPTSIQASGMTISNVNAGYKSFINVMENSMLSITNSNINNVFSFDNGSVLRWSAKNSQVFFTNSVFKYNSAIQGGVFQVENDGIINLTNWTLSNNFAIQAGVVQAQNNGAFSFHYSTISSNYALSFPVGQCFDSILTSVFDNTTISSNTYYNKYSILALITNSTNWGTLCWVNTLFSNFLIMNSNLMDMTTSFYTIQLISSSLEISGMSTISNQMYIIDAFLSTIAIKNSTIRDTLLSGTGINVSASNLTISNMMMNNVSTISFTYPFIQVALGSNLLMDSVNYVNSKAPLLTLIGSSWTISNLNSSNLSIFSHFVKLQQATNATFYNWNLLNVSVAMMFANTFTDSRIFSMVNLNFNAVNWVPFYIINSEINLIDSLIVRNSMSNVLSLSNSKITMMSNTIIDSCGYYFTFYGTLYSANCKNYKFLCLHYRVFICILKSCFYFFNFI